VRFDDDFIQKIIEVTDIADLIGQYTSLKPTGSGLMGRCPFPDHNDKGPSFSVSPHKGVYHCFGCGKSGNAITFLKDHNGLTFLDAVTLLANKAHIALPKDSKNKTDPKLRDLKSMILQANQLALNYFVKCRESKLDQDLAGSYIEKRKLQPETLQTFQLGYAPESWEGLTRYLSQNGIPPDIGVQAQLIRPKSEGSGHYDFFRSRLMFPILDPMGNPIAFGGRIIQPPSENSPANTDQAKYMNSPETPVFHKGKTLFGLYQTSRHIRSQGFAIIVEGYMDVISLYQSGIQNALAPMGTALTLDQCKVLMRYTKSVTVLFDGDQAGIKAAIKSLPILLSAGIIPKGLFLPDGLDPDDFIQKYGASDLQNLIQKAPDLFTLILGQWLEGYRGSASEKIQISEKLAPILNTISDQRLKSLYLEEASWKLGVNPDWWKKLLTTSSLTSPAKSTYFSNTTNSRSNESPSGFSPIETSTPSAQDLLVLSLSGVSALDISWLQFILQFEQGWNLENAHQINAFVQIQSQEIFKKAQFLSRQEGIFFDKVLGLLTTYVDNPEKLFMDQNMISSLTSGGDSTQSRYFLDIAKKIQDRYLLNSISKVQTELKKAPQEALLHQLTHLQKLRQSLFKGQLLIAPLSQGEL